MLLSIFVPQAKTTQTRGQRNLFLAQLPIGSCCHYPLYITKDFQAGL